MEKQQPRYSFEEFKLMYESAEKVTDRRNALNKFNYSICTAIFLAIFYLWNWSLSHEKYNYLGIFVVMILAMIALFFTYHWIQQIQVYKYLNNAKFDVINQMSKQLFFPSQDESITVKSFEPFHKEWELLEKSKAATKSKMLKIFTLSSTTAELFIPRAFRIIFFFVSIVSLLIVIVNFPEFIDSAKEIILL